MKPSVRSAAYFLVAWSILLLSCKKETTSDTVQVNKSPVANAGDDVAINISSCYSGRTVELDGSGSYDPENLLLEYGWRQISGPSCPISTPGNNSPKAQLSNLNPGQYAFELTVTDDGGASGKGLSSKDTVVINVTGSFSTPEYNLDVTFNGSFSFSNDTLVCQYVYDPVLQQLVEHCFYSDYIHVEGKFDLPGLGQMQFGASEYTDTTTFGYGYYTEMGLGCITCDAPSRYLDGISVINFKDLIQQGRGLFSDILIMESGSAKTNCDPDVFENADPLIISGSMDTVTHTINLTIKGKVYF